MKKIIGLISVYALLYNFSFSQTFTHADTLRGSYGEGRNWWDATKYDLYVKFNLKDSTISGYNIISYKVLKPSKLMQVDLQEPMIIDSIKSEFGVDKKTQLYNKIINSNDLSSDINIIKKDGEAYFISIPDTKINTINQLTVYYHGKPRIARKPPWDGGIVWARDKAHNPWISIACQGTGASIWYPCKDHQSDEPDSAELHITTPSNLVSVGNGRLRSKVDNSDSTTTYTWAVVSPINNYCIIPYIGKYVNFNEVYKGEKGNLDMNYWVLDSNLQKAKKQFQDAPRMMKAFEYWFGPYPFYEDGYKLVDAPHLGMEHQSATAYGNGYQNGYHGMDLSGSGWGLKWDFIIVHESGHEWFANNITTKDIADMWVHEGFTNYSETLFTEYYYGKEAATAYVVGIRKNISNDVPIIGPYGVNKEGSGDMYYKAGNMLHTIRQIINDDEKFRMILRGLNAKFYHQTVTSKQVEEYMTQQSGVDLSRIFDQYLRTTQIPTLEYKIKDSKLLYRWTNCIKGFDMPLKINFKEEQWIKPTEQWKTLVMYNNGSTNFSVDENFYVKINKVN